MGCFFDGGDFSGISCTNHHSLIQYNNIQNAGKAGIIWQGHDVTISKNFLNNNVKHLNDMGAIYTYVSNSSMTGNESDSLVNRVIQDNIILNTLGQPYGTSSSEAKVAGIYLDGRTMNVNVTNNTVAYSGKNGIHCNNPMNVLLSGNTLFDNINAISFARWHGTTSTIDIDIPQMDIDADNNICYSRNAVSRDIFYTNNGLTYLNGTETISNDLANLGAINNNYYGHVNQVPFQMNIYNSVGVPITQTSPMSLKGWNALSTKDAASERIKQLRSYIINSFSTTPSNWFNNSGFYSDISGITTVSALASWDNTSQIHSGSLKIEFQAPITPNSYSLHHSSLGTLAANKVYLLKFVTRGTTPNGVLRASLRSTSNISTHLAPVQVRSYDEGLTFHEFVFVNPPAQATSFGIELERNSGTTYIDDVRFVEIDATMMDPNNSVRFDYNNTQTPVTVTLGGNYKDAKNVAFNGSITLQPYTSSILFKSGEFLLTRPMPITATTPVKEEHIGLKVNCYPNPATDGLTIGNLETKDEWQSVEILSLEGKRTGVFSTINTGKTFTVEVKQLQPGKYYAVLTNKKNQTKVLSFIKM